jgi:hypothetical protein
MNKADDLGLKVTGTNAKEVASMHMLKRQDSREVLIRIVIVVLNHRY